MEGKILLVCYGLLLVFIISYPLLCRPSIMLLWLHAHFQTLYIYNIYIYKSVFCAYMFACTHFLLRDLSYSVP